MGKVVHDFHQRRRGRLITTLMARDGEKCMICGTELSRKVKDHDDRQYITFDHIVPRSKGGTGHYSNLRLAHQQCNNERGNDPITNDEELLDTEEQ